MGSELSTEDDCTLNSTLNISSADEAQSIGLMYSDLEQISTAVALPIILIFGLIGNVAFLFTVVRVPGMQTPTNFYLSNLAVSDSAFLLLAICTRLHAYAMYGVPNHAPLLGQLGCALEQFTKYTFNFASLILITFISLERYIAVCHPLRHRLISGRRRSIKLIAVCWLVAAIFAPLVIPASYSFTQYCLSWPVDDPKVQDKFPTIVGRCYSAEGDWALQMFHLTQTVPFFVAFFGNAFFYTRIFLKLHQRDAYDRQRVIRTRNQVAVMLVANGTVFFFTMTAFEVTSMILFIESFLTDVTLIPYDIRNSLFEINRVLVYINSAVNPIVYTLTNARYRRAFRTAFTPRACKGGRRRTSTNSSVAAAHDLYTLSGAFPAVLQPTTLEENAAASQGTYLNVCFRGGEKTGQKEHGINATTTFSSENGTYLSNVK